MDNTAKTAITPNTLKPFRVPAALESEIDGVVSRYPQKRSASVMVLHALQDQFGYISKDAIEWTAAKLGIQPLHVLELVTFYPMFFQAPVGKFHFKICRTLSCMLAGSDLLHKHLCGKFGLDTKKHGLQTTPDGRFTVEYVECLASCGTGPAMMCNDRFFEAVNAQKADQIIQGLEGGKS
jgi:NADH-quinone oxidoreductase subunit E